MFSHVTSQSVNMAATSDSSGSSVRKRRVDSSKTETKCADGSEENEVDSGKDTEKEKELQRLHTGTYWLTRIVLLRSVAFIYCEHADSVSLH